MSSGALVSIANKYGETPTDKAKTPLREVLKGTRVPQDPITNTACGQPQQALGATLFLFPLQSVLRSWARASPRSPTRTRSGRARPAPGPVRTGGPLGGCHGFPVPCWHCLLDPAAIGIHSHSTVGNGTLNKLAGIDYKQLSLSHKLNENQSGEVGPSCPEVGAVPVQTTVSWLCWAQQFWSPLARCREGAQGAAQGAPFSLWTLGPVGFRVPHRGLGILGTLHPFHGACVPAPPPAVEGALARQ